MEEHIDECDHKHCSFVDIPYKIKFWKSLWYKDTTDCPQGKKTQSRDGGILERTQAFVCSVHKMISHRTL